MARIAGVDLPLNKRVQIGLTYIYGIGVSRATKICEEANVDVATKVKDLTEDQAVRIRNIIQREGMVEGDLRKAISMDIKTTHGNRLLSRAASSPGLARTRAANSHQRSHPQGTTPHRRQKVAERGMPADSEIVAASDWIRSESMAEKVKKTGKKKTGKKREKLTIPSGIAHILATFNNTIISITDLEGNLLAASSAGAVGFKGSRKGTPFAAQQAATTAAASAKEYGMRTVQVYLKGPGAGRESAVRALQAAGHRGEKHPRYHPDPAQRLPSDQTSQGLKSVRRPFPARGLGREV